MPGQTESSSAAVPCYGIITANSQSGLSCARYLCDTLDLTHMTGVVRCIVRSEDKKGKILHTLGRKQDDPRLQFHCGVDADDEASLLSAFEGCTSLLVVTPTTATRGPQTQKMLHAAKKANVAPGWVVVVSSWTVMMNHPLSIEQFEHSEKVAADLFPHRAATLRAGYFMSNFLEFGSSVRNASSIFLPMKDAHFAPVDPQDIGASAAAIMLTPPMWPAALRVVDVSGPETVTMQDVTHLLSQILGKEVQYVSVELEQGMAAMRTHGAPDWAVDFVRALIPFMWSGMIEKPYRDVEILTGRRSTLKVFLERHKAVFE